MLKEFAVDPWINEDLHRLKSHIDWCIKYFKSEGLERKILLDVGGESPMTLRMRNELYSTVANTEGDLDIEFYFPDLFYDAIVYSATIEHQFNPLYTLLRLRAYIILHNIRKCPIYIIYPQRGKFLWVKTHYHEIDDYRFRMLMKRAGYKIVNKKYYKSWKQWWKYFTGFRPIYRLFRDFNVCYKVMVDYDRLV